MHLTITLSLGDILIHSIIAIVLPPIVAYFGWKIWIGLSKFWIERSVLRRRRKLASLEKALEKYEMRLTNPVLFIGYLAEISFGALFMFIMYTATFIVAEINYVGIKVIAIGNPNLVKYWWSIAEFYEIVTGDSPLARLATSYLFFGITSLICAIVAWLGAYALRTAADPERYRRRLGQRIDSLRIKMDH